MVRLSFVFDILPETSRDKFVQPYRLAVLPLLARSDRDF